MRPLCLVCLALTLLAGAAAASPTAEAPDLVFMVSERTGQFVGRKGLWLINADGSGLSRLAGAVNGSEDDCCADWSPDGTRLVFASSRDPSPNGAIYTIRFDGTELRRLTSPSGQAGDTLPRWSPDGAGIAWIRSVSNQDDLWFMNGDGASHRRLSPLLYNGQYDWSPTGAEIVWAQEAGGIAAIQVATGAIRQLAAPPGATGRLTQPRWSPDGTQIVFIGEGLEVMHADGGARTVISRVGHDAEKVGVRDPAWSPEGRSIAFTAQRLTGESSRTGPIVRHDLYVVDVDGSDERRLTGALDKGFMMRAGDGNTPSFWPDDSRIFFSSARESNGDELLETTYVMNADGTCEQPFLSGGPLLAYPAWRRGALPQLGPLSCADLRMQADSDRWGALGKDAFVYVTVENDGNVAARGLTVVVHAQGPARARALGSTCRRSTGLACALAPLEPGRRGGVVLAFRSANPGHERIRLSVRSDVQDLDPVASRKTLGLTFLPCTIVGTVFDDTIGGTPRRDRICSVEGRDRVNAYAGNDYVAGGSSGDILTGGAGKDVLLGEGGNDVLLAKDGERDRVDCGWDKDVAVVDRIHDVARGCEEVIRAS